MKSPPPYPAWAPRFWHGMTFGTWSRLVAANSARIHPTRLGLALTVTGMSLFNSIGRRCQDLLWKRTIEATPLVDDPLFILGHWRSGTTYLHELLSCDPQFASPTTFQCFGANHFLLTQRWFPKMLWFLMPKQRPMDNVRTGWDSPQEDEFAICSLGAPSPYLRMAFPNSPNENHLPYLDLEGLPAEQVQQWSNALVYFLRALTLATGRRLVLKSPTHTARLGKLRELFPRARFLHIVRDPRSVVPSTIRLWQVLDTAQALQRPHHLNLESGVHQAYRRMYGAFERDRIGVPEDQLMDVRYEDLVADPVGTLRQAYQQLELGEFTNVEPALQQHLAQAGRYQTNRYSLREQEENRILAEWSDYARRYGYASPEITSDVNA